MGYSYSRRTAAIELSLDDLPEPQAKFVEEITRATGGKAGQAWEGPHGIIVEFENSSRLHGGRLTADILKVLIKNKLFRWITPDKQSSGDFDVGM